MKNKNLPSILFHPLALVAGAVLWAMGQTATATTVTFTLSLDTAKDPGASYTNFRASGAGTQSTYVIGFNVDISAVNGSAVDIAPVAAFCTELAESISATGYTFDAAHLYEAAAGRAGESATASAGIPLGGIGRLRDARIRYLFDQYYESVRLADWTQTPTSPEIHAFQLAVWELGHDTDLSLTSTSGQIHVASQGNTLRDNAIALAQTRLNNVNTAGITESYESTRFDIWALTSASGNTSTGRGFQDVLLALEIGSPAHQTLKPLLPAPEPSSSALVLLAGLLGLRYRRRA